MKSTGNAGCGNTQWRKGNISPEGGQSFEGRPDRSESAADLTEEESSGISAEAMQETIAFAELLKELERPDPAPAAETAAGEYSEPAFISEAAAEAVPLPEADHDPAEKAAEAEAEETEK